jgi:hypothetical protein
VIALEEPAVEPADGAFVVPRSLLPERFRDPQLSGLVREVMAVPDNVIDLDLN